ncbi:MAG TPA: hypothetical protein VF590_13370, partial [Isosphaeraceae bacterium]
MSRPRPGSPSRRTARPRHGRRLLAEALEARTLLSDLTVDLFTDENDGNLSPGDVSLREAIQWANSNPGPDRVLLQAGTYTLSLAGANEDAGATGDLDIARDVDIIGAGRNATIINANRLDRIFDLDGTTTAGALRVTITGMTLTGGLTPTRVANYATGNDGGAIDVYRSSLFVTDCILRDNTTGPGAFSGNGGAIALTSTGTLTVTNSVITGNVTGDSQGSGFAGGGGGIYGNGANITIIDSVISNNRTGIATGTSGPLTAGDGGGIDSESGGPAASLTITNSTISGNSAGNVASTGSWGEGGGISSGIGITLVLDRATITNNTATYQGGGASINGSNTQILNSTFAGNTAMRGNGGGGIYAQGTITLLSGTTISGNQAPNKLKGGGIFTFGAIETIVNSTFSGNVAS